MVIKGNIIDIPNRNIFFGSIEVKKGKIVSIQVEQHNEKEKAKQEGYILPGFIDAHVHIESSMLIPSEFARLAVVHGTVATVSDPHEIANVLGLKGVHYMIKNGEEVPLKFYFGAPSAVPATYFETAGAVINAKDIENLLQMPKVKYLAEMMNYPGVLYEDKEVLAKIAAAKKWNKPIDGHAPGLRGKDAQKYIAAGISTDHECFTYEEALEKLQLGMKILIREGSAAKNFEALIDLLPQYPDKIMFCSDDKHPDDLFEGHINQLVSRAVAKGIDLFDVLQAACINPKKHYNLEVGLLQKGEAADFIIVENLKDFKVKATYINGALVAKEGQSLITSVPTTSINNFNTKPKEVTDFEIEAIAKNIRVIKAIDGEIVTESFIAPAKIENGKAVADIDNDILKIVVVNRYENATPAVAFIHNFNLKKGAIASSVGHDSHNIIAVGVDDASIRQAVNLIIENKGGISAVNGNDKKVLPLPVAGIMTNQDGYEVAKAYSEIDTMVKSEMGCSLTAPFMTLSFMALLVIPELKLSDKGLFDGKAFKMTALWSV